MEPTSHPKKYSKYTLEMRLQLIRLVDQQKLSTAHAARILGIKQTSACRIMKSYHENHKIFERKADRLSRQAKEPKNKTEDVLGDGGFARGEEWQAANGGRSEGRTEAERQPLGDLGVNGRGNLEREGVLSEQMGSLAALPQPAIQSTNEGYLPLYYPAPYPFFFNCFF